MKKLLFLLSLLATSAVSAQQLDSILCKVPAQQRAGAEFLLKYMPQPDRDTLSADFLIEHINWAYKARETFAWARSLPDSIFFNDVLPYASLDESRERWRERFWTLLHPLVEGETDVVRAIDTVTRALPALLGVQYNTKRRKANQSPGESIDIGMASCSGLSIILVDALRTIGIPSRVAGTPLWVSKEGNHNWVEVYVGGKWYFTEYYPAERFNEGWFLERAGKADKSDPLYWIYATSWKPSAAKLHFPMVWNMADSSVAAVDVTDFYIDLYNTQQATSKQGVGVSLKMFADEGRSSADRIACDIRIYNQKGQNIAAGKTKGSLVDMNDYLTLRLPANSTYWVEYVDSQGKKVRKQFVVETKNMAIELSFQ